MSKLSLKRYAMGKITGRLLGLVIVTVVAVVLAISVTASGWGRKEEEKPAVDLKAAPTPVSVVEVRLEPIEVTDTYAGMIRPLERFTLKWPAASRSWESTPLRWGPSPVPSPSRSMKATR